MRDSQRRSRLVVALVAAAGATSLFGATAGQAPATTTPKRCGTIRANGETFAVRGHLTKCRFSRRVSKGYLRHGIEPDGWSCLRYPRKVTSIAFTCRRGIKDIYAIRR